ncbi:MAG: iron-sulfur cluster assembly scaffold protein [Candidatus Thorarchaeota archaeon]|nr:MAG: iron-sulfur cluster assembly scaffold protein [Candidatus Thorarchaeota archaeon]
MKSTQYSKKVLDHFRNPRNVGTLEGDDVAVGKVGNPICGDLMEVFIKVKDDRIVDAKFMTFGCGSAIATSSMTTELVKGMTLEQAMEVTREDVASELEGLPPIKMHCSNLAADALHEAIKRYRARMTGEVIPGEETQAGGAECAIGKENYLGKGVYLSVTNPEDFKEKRVLVVHTGDKSLETAIELSKHTGRVVLLTPDAQIRTNTKLKEDLEASGIKILYGSKLLEIRGQDEVEKVLVHNLNEDEKYDLFVDAVVLID